MTEPPMIHVYPNGTPSDDELQRQRDADHARAVREYNGRQGIGLATSPSGMNHACLCGHGPGEHYGENGHCDAYDVDAGWLCKCSRYEWGGDD